MSDIPKYLRLKQYEVPNIQTGSWDYIANDLLGRRRLSQVHPTHEKLTDEQSKQVYFESWRAVDHIDPSTGEVTYHLMPPQLHTSTLISEKREFIITLPSRRELIEQRRIVAKAVSRRDRNAKGIVF